LLILAVAILPLVSAAAIKTVGTLLCAIFLAAAGLRLWSALCAHPAPRRSVRVKMTETYQHTIGGLLQKRAEMMEEIAVTRERLAILSNDVEAIDRVLERLGYSGDVKLTPRVPRIVLFYRGELRQFLLGQLREHGPATSRTLAERLVQIEQKDARDRRMMADVVRRIGKALRQMQDSKMVTRERTKSMGEYSWQAV
jgi:hypothetical protein